MTTIPAMDLNGKKVLIVRFSALGDCIRTIPAVVGMMKAFPQTSFYWLVENSSAGLLRHIPGLNLIEVDRGRLHAKHPGRVWHTLQQLVKTIKNLQFDVSVDFHGVAKSGLLPWLAGIPLRIGYERGGSKEGHRWLIHRRFRLPSTRVSRYEKNLALARYIHPEIEAEIPQFQLTEAQEQRVTRAMRETPILLFPGTSEHGRNKRWPAQSWAWLYRRLRQKHACLFVFGPADQEYRDRLSELLGPDLASLPPLSLLELTLALKSSKFLVSCDSGPMHLAAILQVPIVAMLGPSDPVLNRPLPGPQRLILPQVPCAPCRRRSCSILICQSATTPKRVFEAACQLLNTLAAPPPSSS